MKNKRDLLLVDKYENILPAINNQLITETIEEKIERVELKNEIIEQINSLDNHYRDVLLLYYYMNLSYTEIAQKLNIKEGTVKSRVSRAKNLIKAKITQNNISDYFSYGKGGK